MTLPIIAEVLTSNRSQSESIELTLPRCKNCGHFVKDHFPKQGVSPIKCRIAQCECQEPVR